MKNDAIYDVVSKVNAPGRGWFVILRNQDGTYLSYLLPSDNEPPPPIFKRIKGKDGKIAYAPYP